MCESSDMNTTWTSWEERSWLLANADSEKPSILTDFDSARVTLSSFCYPPHT